MSVLNPRLRTRGIVALGAVLLMFLAACSGTTPAAPSAGLDTSRPASLRIAWSGSQDRTDRTLKAIDRFKAKYPNVTVEYESTTSTNFWDKLTTQVAGGNAPDIIQMSGQTLKQYVDNGALMAIQPYVDNGRIDLRGWEQPLLDAQSIDGTIYGIPPGVDGHAIIYNASLLKKIGVAEPAANWTWDDFAAFAKEVRQKGGSKIWGSENNGLGYEAFQVFLAQRGKTMFAPDGSAVGFEAQDLKDWWRFWGDLQTAGAAVPAEIQQEKGLNPENSGVIKGFGAVDFSTSSQFTNFVSLTSDTLKMALYPSANDGTGGQVWRAGLAWSITKNSKSADWAAELINFLVNDSGAGADQGTTRGVPASPTIRAQVEAASNDVDKQVFKNLADVQALPDSKITPVLPAGFSTWVSAFQRTYFEYAFGQKSLDDAVNGFMTEGASALS